MVYQVFPQRSETGETYGQNTCISHRISRLLSLCTCSGHSTSLPWCHILSTHSVLIGHSTTDYYLIMCHVVLCLFKSALNAQPFSCLGHKPVTLTSTRYVGSAAQSTITLTLDRLATCHTRYTCSTYLWMIETFLRSVGSSFRTMHLLICLLVVVIVLAIEITNWQVALIQFIQYSSFLK